MKMWQKIKDAFKSDPPKEYVVDEVVMIPAEHVDRFWLLHDAHYHGKYEPNYNRLHWLTFLRDVIGVDIGKDWVAPSQIRGIMALDEYYAGSAHAGSFHDFRGLPYQHDIFKPFIFTMKRVA